MLKAITLYALVAVLIIALGGCGEKVQEETTETTTEQIAEPAEPMAEPMAEKTGTEKAEHLEQQETVTLDEREVEMLACAIYCEAGGDACSDLCRRYVGDVIINRVEDDRFPETIEEVLMAKGQYGRFHWTGIVWPERAQLSVEKRAVERAYETARELLAGNHSALYGAGYIWQAEFKQGTDILCESGMFFGR